MRTEHYLFYIPGITPESSAKVSASLSIQWLATDHSKAVIGV